MSTRVLGRRVSVAAAIVAAAAAGTGAAAPAASTSAPAQANQSAAVVPAKTAAVTAGQAARRPGAPAYRFLVVAPQRRPDGSRDGGSTQAAGISEDGVVAGTSWSSASTLVFAGDGTRNRWLTSGTDGPDGAPYASAVGPDGRVVGSYAPPVGRLITWDRAGTARTLDAKAPGFLVGEATNRAGQVAGTLSSTKVCASVHVFDRAAGSRAVAPPVTSRCQVSGLSDRGLVVGTLTTPPLPHQRHFSRAFALTGHRFVDLRGAQAKPSTAETISPDGAHLIGRQGTINATGEFTGTVVRWSTNRRPRPVPGAGTLVPQDVNNRGQILGVAGGRATLWTAGRLVDLTTTVRGLPRGWSISQVSGINERGEIAATLTQPIDSHQGRNHAVKLIPTRR